MNKKPYCTAPWTGIQIAEDGKVKVCCEANTVLGDVSKQPIEEIVDNEIHKKIKEDVLAGRKSDNCVKCFRRIEISGEAPMMNHSNRLYPDIEKGLQFVDLRWNNLCNLTCIYCNETASSSWMRKKGMKERFELRNVYDLSVENWLIEHTPNATLFLIGGEPMLIKQNQNLLSKISKDTTINILTNMAYDMKSNPIFEQLLEWPADKVHWNMSMENTGEKYEWIRPGADWQQVEDNIKFMRTTKFAESMTFVAVHGLFSGFDFFETYKTFFNLGVKKASVQNLMGSPSLEIFECPRPMLELALEQLEKTYEWQQKELAPEDRELYPIVNLDGVINKLKTLIANDHKGSLTKESFDQKINELDQISGKSFKDLWPDVYELVQQHC